MVVKIKELAKKKEVLTSGHRMCAGCGAPVAARHVLLASPENSHLVISNSTGCMEVSTCLYPYTAWRSSYIHSAFENGPATLSGIEVAYRHLKAQGRVKGDFYFVNFAGDGGTYDIGLQALSGALERGHRAVFVCYNNEAYMNTGTQCSSATPYGSWSSTSPISKCNMEGIGKINSRKDLTAIVAAHNIPYVAQCGIHNFRDTFKKAEKAFSVKGPAFLNILAPCPRGWRFPVEKTVELSRLAYETCVWPLYEVDGGTWRITARPKVKKPVEDFLRLQGRFQHLFYENNREHITKIQSDVDEEWRHLQERCYLG